MVLSISELSKTDFTVTRAEAIYQQRTYKVFTQKSRKLNGFILIDRGEGDFHYGTEVIHIDPGTIIYLPHGSEHVLTVNTDEINFYRIDFSLEADGEPLYFSTHPLLIARNAGSDYFEMSKNLCSVSLTDNRLEKAYILYGFFDLILKEQSTPCRTLPAVEYIKTHYKDVIDCHELAKMCFLSTAQFYRVFEAENGISPLKFRDEILIKKARLLLREEQTSITETAFLLGFTDASYFSRFFKKNTGISPSEY